MATFTVMLLVSQCKHYCVYSCNGHEQSSQFYIMIFKKRGTFCSMFIITRPVVFIALSPIRVLCLLCISGIRLLNEPILVTAGILFISHNTMECHGRDKILSRWVDIRLAYHKYVIKPLLRMLTMSRFTLSLSDTEKNKQCQETFYCLVIGHGTSTDNTG